jgi:hypothetical protein
LALIQVVEQLELETRQVDAPSTDHKLAFNGVENRFVRIRSSRAPSDS